MKARIYIAGPMSGLPDLNYPVFNAMAKRLRALSHEVCNPAENPACVSWEAYMRLAIAQLITCNTILMMSGWTGSRGACIEYRLAVELGMCVKNADEVGGL